MCLRYEKEDFDSRNDSRGDLGNTVIVEGLGPAAGRHGGEVVFAGKTDKLMKADTLTAKYLRAELQVEVPEKRTKPWPKTLPA